MNINGHNPYKRGFDMLVADIQAHEGRCVTPSASEPFSATLTAKGVNRLGDTIAELRMEVARLRSIEAAAVAAVNSEQWQGDAFHERMCELSDVLHGDPSADEPANAEITGRASGPG